jgi:DNA (cytosine-5)-methyltransferase 1
VKSVPVIDLFAGPGGLGEGFSSLADPRGNRAFSVRLSVEKDAHAHQTLLLRSFFRKFERVPTEYYEFLRGKTDLATLFARYRKEAVCAADEAWQAELGVVSASDVHSRIRRALGGSASWVLVGGPPCQAYSIVGRSRNRGNVEYRPEKDKRHYLYREYLKVLAEHRPPVFVIENVKGLLSATVSDERVFDRMVEDLQAPRKALDLAESRPALRYELHSVGTSASEQQLITVRDYVVASERHGLPQARHRLILLGVRSDIAETPGRLPECQQVSAADVLSDLPPLRSGLTGVVDSAAEWRALLLEAKDRRWYQSATSGDSALLDKLKGVLTNLAVPKLDRGGRYVDWSHRPIALASWFHDEAIRGVCNHEARLHMPKDIHRYLFASAFASVHRRSPILADFPADLRPEHANIKQGVDERVFADRFRVHLEDRPAATITSHIAKDGHYYIHYDPRQSRSFTVREAARLQTFPDNYFFAGARTPSYIQVGNAVPPLLAAKIAALIQPLVG